VLEQEGEVRSQRGQQRTDEPHADRQRDAGHCGTVFRAFTERKGATAEAGAVLRNSRHAVQLVAHTGAELADEPHISHDTVRTHVPSAMTKLGARSRAHLVAKALGDGLLLA
jgi:DNA-binding CsgD family transcriptional regulator